MSADVLRRAASLMRERAGAASAGPWKRFGMAGVAGAEWEVVDERRVECECGEPVALLGCATNADAVHIAAADPPFMLAVADWLDDTAETWEMQTTDDGFRRATYNIAVGYTRTKALAVARAYLGADA